MTDRITRADVDRIAATISETLPGSRVLEIEARNGYIAVDWADDRGTVDHLYAGTKREVYTYLQGMRRGYLLAGKETS